MVIDERNIATEHLMVRSADTERHYRATLPFIFALCQEVAGEHAALRGMDIQTLNRDEHCTWIVSRTKIDFSRTPSWRDQLDIMTMPLDGFHLFCPRYIEASDQEGRKVFEAMTHWIVMDLDKKRPVRPKMIAERLVLPEEGKDHSPDIGKIKKYDDQEKLEELGTYVPQITWFDTDFNHHINNVVYIKWITEALPADILESYETKSIDVQWESQTYEGDDVTVETSVTERTEDTVTFAQRIKRHEKDGDDTILFEANSVWSKMK